jgi:hypothetical protein
MESVGIAEDCFDKRPLALRHEVGGGTAGPRQPRHVGLESRNVDRPWLDERIISSP